MAKELIFMGRKAGKVRLALFDSSHGTARRLPVKEIDEEVFVSGIKEGVLPVRGFGVGKTGRITCKYGDWYKLPEVQDGGALSLFGIVWFGQEPYDEEGRLPDMPYQYLGTEQLQYYGIASVDWDTGMFRVLAPCTYFHILNNGIRLLYCYGGPILYSRLRPKANEALGAGTDYLFSECDSTESISDIMAWANMTKAVPVYLQWIFQRCENIACLDGDKEKIDLYMSMNGYDSVAIVLLGKRPIDVLELPLGLNIAVVRKNREVGVVRSPSKFRLVLYGFNNMTVECVQVKELCFDEGTRARLVRNPDSPLMEISGWEGFEGSGGDYTGFNIEYLQNCFNKQPDVSHLIFDAVKVANCFKYVVPGQKGLTIEFTKPVQYVSWSFWNFEGAVLVDGMVEIYQSFKNCLITNGLDLSKTEFVDSAITNTGCTTLKMPEFFGGVCGESFVDTPIRHVKICPDAPSLQGVYYGRSISIKNSELLVDVHVCNSKTRIDFSYLTVKELLYSAPEGSYAPQLAYTAVLPSRPVTGATKLREYNFKHLYCSVLDFSVFPDVAVVPENTIYESGISTLIFGPNIRQIASKAVVGCDNLRWVYVPDTVTDVGQFIVQHRVPYTIFTQKGSAADKLAKKLCVEVQYVSDVMQFRERINELPEVMEGAVIVSILAGTGDGEESAVMSACRQAEVLPELQSVLRIEEKLHTPVVKVEWLERWVRENDLSSPEPFSAHRYTIMAYASNNAPCNEDVLLVSNDAVLYGIYAYRSGEYSMVGRVLDTRDFGSSVLWVVLKGDIVINAFTERVSSVLSSCSLNSMLKVTEGAAVEFKSPTALTTILEHLNFTDTGLSVRGKRLPSKVYRAVAAALRSTYAPLGFYKSKMGSRGLVAVDVTNLQLVVFLLPVGATVDDGRFHRRAADVWAATLRYTGGVRYIDNLQGWSCMYSLIGGGDAAVASVVGADTVKCQEYDYTLPTGEVEALRKIRSVLSGYGTPSVSVAELKAALRQSGLCRKITAEQWNRIKKKTSVYRCYEYFCSDASFVVERRERDYACFFVFGDAGDDGVYACCISLARLETVVREITEVYDYDFAKLNWREEHYAHVNCMLPASEFFIVRYFSFGGTYTGFATFNPVLAVSKISGKVCAGAVVSNKLIPVFWANTFADCIRILEACGFTPFSYKRELLYANCESITSGLFRNGESYKTGVPDYTQFAYSLRNTRDALRRGECTGFACVNGIQKIFDLALKHPPASDYMKTGGEQ